MSERLTRVVLAVLAVTGLEVGLWALFAPRSFYDDFPGGGRSWVSADGPYNEHLVRDVGAFNLAVTLVVVLAFVWIERRLVIVAASAVAVYGIPHAVYHLAHLDAFDGSDAVGIGVATALQPLLALVLLAFPAREAAPVGPPAEPSAVP
jgi:hypothetical protein